MREDERREREYGGNHHRLASMKQKQLLKNEFVFDDDVS